MNLLKQAAWRIFQGIGGAFIVFGALIQLAGMRFREKRGNHVDRGVDINMKGR